MAFGTGASSARGGSPGFRFAIYATLSIVIMTLDQKGEYLEKVRYGLSIAAQPIQLAVSSPSAAWRWLQESFATRESLQAENARLVTRNRELEQRSMRYEALAHENDELRGLREALPPVAERWIVAEIVDIQLNSLRQRVLINRGTRNGLFKGQAVLDDKGLLGQTTHVGPFSAEVILITDPEHAVPVQIERTGLRTIAVGTGDTASLALPYLPANADVKAGDVLTTSGLGGVFPAGYPVGRVVEVHRDAVQPLAQVRAEPFASMNIDREVMLVWFREGHPAAPVSLNGGDAQTGNPKMQSQPVPPRKAPTPATPATAVPAPQAAAPASPGDAATPQAPPKPAVTKPAAKPAPSLPKGNDEKGPTKQEAAPAKSEPKGTQPAPAQPPQPRTQSSNPSVKASVTNAVQPGSEARAARSPNAGLRADGGQDRTTHGANAAPPSYAGQAGTAQGASAAAQAHVGPARTAQGATATPQAHTGQAHTAQSASAAPQAHAGQARTAQGANVALQAHAAQARTAQGANATSQAHAGQARTAQPYSQIRSARAPAAVAAPRQQ